MRTLALSTLAAAFVASQSAAAVQTCVTPAEARAVAGIATGPLLRALATQCAANHPGVSTTLAAARSGLETRFRAQADAGWAVARPKMLQIFNVPAGDAQEAENTGRALLPVIVEGGVRKNLSERNCQMADLLATAILPLPDDAVVGLMGAFVAAGLTDPKARLPLCQAASLTSLSGRGPAGSNAAGSGARVADQ